MPGRYESFTFRLTKDERRLLQQVAQQVSRSQADTIRLLVKEAAQVLARPETQCQTKPPEGTVRT